MFTSVLVAAAILLTAQALLVAGVAAVRPRGNIYVAIVVVAVATAPAAFFCDRVLFSHPLDADGRLFLVLMHLALGGFLFQFMTLPDRSVTLRILVEILLEPNQSLSVDALARRYSVRTMILSRLDQLAGGAFVSMAPDGRLTIEPRGMWLARFVSGGRRLFRITSAN